jgi:hypothetical protein
MNRRYPDGRLTPAPIIFSFIVVTLTTSCSAPKQASLPTAQQEEHVGSTEPDARVAAHKDPKLVTDQQIANAVDHTLLTDAALHRQQVIVAVHQGIVTLSGGVDNLMAEERAGRLAETIMGVRGVVNTKRRLPETDGLFPRRTVAPRLDSLRSLRG